MSREMSVKRAGSKSKSLSPERKKVVKDLEDLMEIPSKRNHRAPAMKAPSKDSIEDLIESDDESGFDLESSDVDDKPMKQLAPRKGAVEEDSEEDDEEDSVEVFQRKSGGRGVQVQLLNDLDSDEDERINGRFYSQETENTAVVYEAFNMKTGKSYIGSAYSYEKHGDQPSTEYGTKGRFKRHWSNKSSGGRAYNDCPVFYEALRNSDIHDWYIFTLKVSHKKHIKRDEKKLIEKLGTYSKKYGYNYLVGTKKPLDAEYNTQYTSAKIKSNVERAVGGKMKNREHSKDLPPNINYRISKKKDGTKCGEGYFVQIKIDGVLYNKAFLSMTETMEVKLQKAIQQLAEFKKQAAKKQSGKKSKTMKKSLGKRNH
jgi:hypothetical protein